MWDDRTDSTGGSYGTVILEHKVNMTVARASHHCTRWLARAPWRPVTSVTASPPIMWEFGGPGPCKILERGKIRGTLSGDKVGTEPLRSTPRPMVKLLGMDGPSERIQDLYRIESSSVPWFAPYIHSTSNDDGGEGRLRPMLLLQLATVRTEVMGRSRQVHEHPFSFHYFYK